MSTATDSFSTEYEYDLDNGYCSQLTLFLNNVISKDVHVAVRVHSRTKTLQVFSPLSLITP